jgi:hypothetical protein
MLNASQRDWEFIYPKPDLNWSLKIDSADPDGASRSAEKERTLVSAHGAVLLAAFVTP